MNTKEARLKRIEYILKEERIGSQARLLKILRLEGFDVTQATLSRDLKALQAGKIFEGSQGYYYGLPQESFDTNHNYIWDIQRGIISIDLSENILVIRTRIGHASTVAAALDYLEIPGILGSVAGDDTIIAVLGVENKEHVMEALKNYGVIPE